MKTKPDGYEVLILELILCLFVVVAIPDLFWAFVLWTMATGSGIPWASIILAGTLAGLVIPIYVLWIVRPGAEIPKKRVLALELSWLPVGPFALGLLADLFLNPESTAFFLGSLVIGILLFILQAVLVWRQVQARAVASHAYTATKESDVKAEWSDSSCPISGIPEKIPIDPRTI